MKLKDSDSITGVLDGLSVRAGRAGALQFPSLPHAVLELHIHFSLVSPFHHFPISIQVIINYYSSFLINIYYYYYYGISYYFLSQIKQLLLNAKAVCCCLLITSRSHLICSGGLFDEDHQPSSSSPSSAATLFSAYKQLAVPLDSEGVVWGCNGLRVPGYAFKNERPYIALKEAHVLTYCSHQVQRDFYQEAKIKTIVFMGCKKGEIELGSCNAISQVNMETRLKEIFQVFSKVQESPILIPEQQQQQISSSSSSLRSTESPESSLIFAFPGASQVQPEATPLQPPEPPYPQPLSMLLRSPLLPSLDSEHSAMTSAILAVLSSPSSSTHSSPTPPQFMHHLFQQPPQERVQMRRQQRPSAFTRFGSRDQPRLMTACREISMMKRSILYYGRLNAGRRVYYGSSGVRSTATQLHHMMSERKRREKQNELFQALRSLLPPKTKKDKSAVLTTARNQMKLLQEQVRDLQKKNESLQAQLSLSPPSSSKQHTDHGHQEQITVITSSTSTSRSEPPHEVMISEVAESTSDGSSRTVDLRIRVHGAECPMDALIIRLLELIRRDHRTMTLVSMEARNTIMQPLPFTYITMRLRIQGTDDEWDELSFQEAVRRVVADVAP